MEKSYLRFLSDECYIILPKSHEHYYLGTKKGNFLFSQLINVNIKDVIEKESSVQILFDNDICIFIDTNLEPAGDNFQMGNTYNPFCRVFL